MTSNSANVVYQDYQELVINKTLLIINSTHTSPTTLFALNDKPHAQSPHENNTLRAGWYRESSHIADLPEMRG